MDQKFYVDDYFHIGQMHLGSGKPCQDYSFSGVQGSNAFAVVSDGCSTGRHTDVGARIVALSTVNTLRQAIISHRKLNQIHELVSQEHAQALYKSIEAFGLDFQDMLATCIYCLITHEGGLVGIQGDGVIAKVYKDGAMALSCYQWDNNTPLYPAYAFDGYKGFIAAHGGDINKESLRAQLCSYSDDGLTISSNLGISLAEAIRGREEYITKQEMDNLSFIAVFTDGVMQVEGMSWQEAVLQLLAFKNVEGEFAKRRMIRFIKDSKKNDKKGPLDDISYAIIRMKQEDMEVGDGA